MCEGEWSDETAPGDVKLGSVIPVPFLLVGRGCNPRSHPPSPDGVLDDNGLHRVQEGGQTRTHVGDLEAACSQHL